MRILCAVLGVVVCLGHAAAMPLPPPGAPWPEAALRWIKAYRAKPDPQNVPGLIRMLSQHSAFKDPESSGIYVGFLAGVLAADPSRSWTLIKKTLPLPFEDQWLVIKALAYSGLPNWKEQMRVLALHLPDRQVMANHFMNGDLIALQEVPLEPAKPSTMEKVSGFFSGDWLSSEKKPTKRVITYATNPELIDTLWGFYYATGSATPIRQMVELLPWAKERDNVDKLTIGSMARFTLASNAAKDADLLKMIKQINKTANEATQPILAEVIDAAETVDTGRLGKEALAAIEELKRKGPGSTRDLASWGAAGETALSLGCLGLAVAGQGAAGIPCVVGGALTSGALKLINRQD